MADRIRDILAANPALFAQMEKALAQAAIANPHHETNPVRTMDQWFAFVERFARCMPWQGMDIGEKASFFRRIDQNIGYFYFLLGDLQYEPHIAQWLKEYNIAWGEWLSGEKSWNDEYYRLARTDKRFELDTERYESPENWHSWNDFFARRLNHQLPITNDQFIAPCDGEIADAPVKTATIVKWIDLLGDSSWREVFADGETFHIVLDVFDYHRFHAPCDGQVLECQTIQGIHAGGGEIIWDEAQGRYRYEQCGVTDFQMLETRGVLMMETKNFGKIAIVPVGVQQVSSVVWDERVQPGKTIQQGQELGKFLFGGSDIVLLFERDKAPQIEKGKKVKAGDPLGI